MFKSYDEAVASHDSRRLTFSEHGLQALPGIVIIAGAVLVLWLLIRK